MNLLKFLLIYIAAISLVSVIVTIYDKFAAKKLPKNRTPERSLMILGLVGGATAMFFTMLMIRHKTKHAKFMVGLPIFIILHVALLLAIARL